MDFRKQLAILCGFTNHAPFPNLPPAHRHGNGFVRPENNIFFFKVPLRDKGQALKIFGFPSTYWAQQREKRRDKNLHMYSFRCSSFSVNNNNNDININNIIIIHHHHRAQCPCFSASTTPTHHLNVRIERLAPARPQPPPRGSEPPSAPPQRPTCAPCTCAAEPSPRANGGRPLTARPGMASPCLRSAPLPIPLLRRGTPLRGRAPHLLLALVAEAQARGPLLVAVAVVGAGLVRLELHHPPGPGWGGGCGAGPRSRGRAGERAGGRACCGRPRTRARAPGSGGRSAARRVCGSATRLRGGTASLPPAQAPRRRRRRRRPLDRRRRPRRRPRRHFGRAASAA